MRQVRSRACVIELEWRETAAGEWVAVLKGRRAGERVEARSEQELQVALERFIRAPDHVERVARQAETDTREQLKEDLTSR